ncbi:hypothetical protein AgCh_040134 [Apium graveolens]
MEVAKGTVLGRSLQVPSVYEIAKEKIAAVPSRYVRSDQEPIFSSPNPELEVPVIDMEILLDGDVMDTELNKLHHACKDWGFFQRHYPFSDFSAYYKYSLEIIMDHGLNLAYKFYVSMKLINHRVSDSLLDQVKTEVAEFFKLPLEEKKKFGQLDGDVEGYGQAFVVSNEQKLDWADMFYMITLPADLRKPHLMPQLPLPFR